MNNASLALTGGIAAALLLLPLTPSHALSIDKKDSRFALFLERQEILLDYGSQDYDTSIEKLYISFAEPMIGGGLMGMNLGQLGVTQSDNPDTSGITAAGYRLGLWFEFTMPRKTTVQLKPRVFFDYGSARGKNSNSREVEYSWWEYGAVAMLQVNISNITLGAGPAYNSVSGRQRISDRPNRSFEAWQRQQWLGEIKFMVNSSGYIGMQLAGGDNRLFNIYFERKY